jgi:hypothetical protein
MGKHDEGVVGFPRISWYVSDIYILLCTPSVIITVPSISQNVLTCTHSPQHAFYAMVRITGQQVRSALAGYLKQFVTSFRVGTLLPSQLLVFLLTECGINLGSVGISVLVAESRTPAATSSDISPTRIPPRSSTSPNAPLYRTADRLDGCFVVACVGMGPSA